LVLAHVIWVLFAVEKDELPDPAATGFFGAD
jgi:hypothetical protein